MKQVKTIGRNICCICGFSDIKTVVKTPPIPLFQGCFNSDTLNDEISISQVWGICPQCSTVQLTKLIPAELLYSYHHAESYGSLWDQHHREFAAFIFHNSIGEICEIGGGIGKLAKSYRDLGGDSKWFNLEPTDANPFNIANYEVMPGLLDINFRVPNHVRTIIFSHSLEHLFDPLPILEMLNHQMSESDRILLSWPVMEDWLANGSPGAINWEHTFYIRSENLEIFFRRNGFELVSKKKFKNDHSIFMTFERRVNMSRAPFGNFFEQSIAAVNSYFNNFQVKVEQVKSKISSEQNIYLMPASIYGQYLYVFGLNGDKVIGVLDNSKIKQGKFLYGTKLKIYSPEAINFTQSELDSVVVIDSPHYEEIKKGIKNINPNLKIINVNN